MRTTFMKKVFKLWQQTAGTRGTIGCGLDFAVTSWARSQKEFVTVDFNVADLSHGDSMNGTAAFREAARAILR